MTSNDGAVQGQSRDAAIQRLLRPRSMAIVGVSSAPGSVGLGVWNNLKHFDCDLQTYFVSRKREEVDGHACVHSVDELPEGIDVAVLCVPAHAAVVAVEACARRGVAAVVLFGAGYAESGEEGRQIQTAIVEIATQSGMAVAGPNCMGLTNFVDGIPLTFAPGLQNTPTGSARGLAILTQSGGMMSNLREMSQAKGVPISYAISTGNEAALGVEDYLAYLLTDEHTKVVAMYMEQIRNPAQFLALAGEARRQQKSLILLHPGRSAASREAAQSHTGALVGDLRVIQTLLEAAGVVMVESIEDLVDVAHILTHFSTVPAAGPAILTDSGALKGFALDYAASVRLDLPMLSAATCSQLNEVMPAYTTASNPLDITAQALSEMNLYADTASALLRDEAIGSLLVVVLPGSAQIALRKAQGVLPALAESGKPAVFVVMGEGSPLSDELLPELARHHVPLFRSPERAMRALAVVNRHARQRAWLEAAEQTSKPANQGEGAPIRAITAAQFGPLPEHRGKQLLAGVGIPVPAGRLCHTLDDAVALAIRIGYPLVLKAQAAALTHKSDVGGVVVGIDNEAKLHAGWTQLHSDVQRARPELVLDGVLVERMAQPGVEMVVGAKRDAAWGPVLMVGMGGIWIEVFQDVRLLPPDLSEDVIVQEILSLRSVALLTGARGGTHADVRALAAVVAQVGQVMLASPDVQEIDLNPVVVYREGAGVQVLDALIVGGNIDGVSV